jgi:membrane protein
VKVKAFFRCLGKHLYNDDIMDSGAMLAYYAMLALFPMLVFVVSIAMAVLPVDTVHEGVRMATQTLPSSVHDTLNERANALIDASGAGFAVLGALLGLYGASRGVVALMTALNRTFRKAETRSWIRRQLIAVAVTAAVAVLVLVALGLLVLGPIVSNWLGNGTAVQIAWTVLRWIGAGLLVMIVWGVLYKFLPDTDAPFRIFTPGAIVGVLLWLGISYLFGIYLAHFGRYEVVYGALGTAIIFLTWLWLSNMALLFGAEIDDALADIRAPHDEASAVLADKHEHQRDRGRDHAPAPA